LYSLNDKVLVALLSILLKVFFGGINLFPSYLSYAQTVYFFIGGVERIPIASGRRFMTDLLVSSLMVDGGLQVSIITFYYLSIPTCS
jgi:hypothetical protein